MTVLRIECPACLEIAEAQLIRVVSGAATFRCDACAGEVTAELETRPPASAGQSADGDSEVACPKCEALLAENAANCQSCGLNRANFSSFDADGPTASPALAAAWQRVDGDWDDDTNHEKFAAEVALRGDFRHGASWYRQATADEGRSEKAQEMLDRIQSMATATLLSTKPKVEPEQEPYKNVIILLMVLLFLGAGVGLVLMNGSDQKDTQGQTPPQRGRK